MRWGRFSSAGGFRTKNDDTPSPERRRDHREDLMKCSLTFAGAMVCLASFACQGARADSVKIALPVASLESMPIYIAQANGLFKKHDVEVDVITSRGGGEAMKAFISGDVQIVTPGFPAVGLL